MMAVQDALGKAPMDRLLLLAARCLIGNFSAEASEHSEVIRRRLVEIYEGDAPVGRVLFESGCEKRRAIAQKRLR